MSLEWPSILNWLKTIGSFTGLVSFMILVYRWRRERPILKFHVKDCCHVFYDSDDYGTERASHMYVDLVIDNIGEKNTTIKDIAVKKIIPSRLFSDIKFNYEDHKDLFAHNSIRLNLEIKFPKIELTMKTIEIEFNVIHTHGKNSFKAISQLR